MSLICKVLMVSVRYSQDHNNFPFLPVAQYFVADHLMRSSEWQQVSLLLTFDKVVRIETQNMCQCLFNQDASNDRYRYLLDPKKARDLTSVVGQRLTSVGHVISIDVSQVKN